MVVVAFTQQAINDIDDIATYIAKDSPHYASLQVRRIIDKVQILEQFPFTGRTVPELKRKNIRELIEGNYRIIYHIVSEHLIHILSVHHSKRRLRPNRLLRK